MQHMMRAVQNQRSIEQAIRRIEWHLRNIRLDRLRCPSGRQTEASPLLREIAQRLLVSLRYLAVIVKQRAVHITR